jgi:hypothetical protein
MHEQGVAAVALGPRQRVVVEIIAKIAAAGLRHASGMALGAERGGKRRDGKARLDPRGAVA